MSQSSSTAGSGNIARLSGLLSVAVGVFGLLVGAVLMYASIQGELDSEQATGAAQEQARSIADSLTEIQAALQSPQVIELAREALRSSSRRSEALEAAVQSRGVPNIIDLRIFPAAVEEITLGEYPEPDFTVIEMLLEARASGQAPIQVHYPGQSNENLALAQAVEVNAGVEGILFLRVPVSMVSSLLGVSSYLDSVSIVQGSGAEPYVLRGYGQARGNVERTPISGSRLSLNWTRRTFASSFSKQSAVIILSIGLILLMVGLLVRKRFGALDASSLGLQRKPRKQAATNDQPPASRLPAKPTARKKPKKPTPAAASVATPDPVVDDLPDWLLDSDQIDQSDAPLGGLGVDQSGIPDLPDTLSESVDDTVGIESRATPSDGNLVADTVFFDQDDADFFEPEEGRYDSKSPVEQEAVTGSDAVDTEQIEDADLPFSVADDKRADDESTGLDYSMPEETSDPSLDPIAEIESATDSSMGWDDFKNEAEDEDLLPETDQAAIEAAVAELDEDPALDESAASEAALDDSVEQESEQAADSDAPSDSPAADLVASGPVLDASLFLANSISGVVGEHLDARAATLIGEAIGSEARSRGIERLVIGRDGRFHGAMLMSAMAQGLQASGINVIDIGAVPIPVLNFAASELTDGSGVMVTGSHYPAEHNGFRIRLQHELLHDSAIQAIRKRIDSQDLTSGSGTLDEDSLVERYIERIGIDIQLERPLKVVVDCGNGIAGTVVPEVLGAIGADVIPLYSDVDGAFPNHLPDPSNPDNLEDLKLCVRNFQADLGLAFDGDGDRLAMVSGEGEVVWTDRVLMLLAPEILERNPGARVVIDSASSLALRELIQAAGGKPVIERSAEAFVDARMRKDGALLGGLFSGHLFIAERWYPFDDAIYASARLLELLAADTRTIAEILEQLPAAEGTPEIRIPVEPEQAEELLTALIAEGDFGEGKLSMVDGLRVDYADGWGLIRASHRGQDLVLRFEAESSQALNRIKTVFKKQIKARDASINLLF